MCDTWDLKGGGWVIIALELLLEFLQKADIVLVKIFKGERNRRVILGTAGSKSSGLDRKPCPPNCLAIGRERGEKKGEKRGYTHFDLLGSVLSYIEKVEAGG